jgi:DNA repair photolyase
MDGEAIRGRGAAENPAGRFERLSYEPDAEAEAWEGDDAAPRPRTEYYRDHSRSILTRNDSPDVGFTHSVNPYRGCEHGCVYCVSGDTPILTADGRTRPIADLSVGDEIYGTVRDGWYRRYARTRVLAHWRTVKPAYRVVVADGTELIASGDHRFLTERGWKPVAASEQGEMERPYLGRGDRLIGAGRAADRPAEGQVLEIDADLRVVSVEPLGIEIPMYDITTGTGDFFANGVVSHNCYARPTHEWLGLSAGLDFETKIFVKEAAPELLRRALSSPKWTGEPVAMSGVTDPYQPVERRLRITRGCLEVLAECRNPVGIVTKSRLVTRDADLLGELAAHGAAAVHLSITTLDPDLQRVMEPRAATPARRLEAIAELAAAGVPVGVLVAPVIPGLTDHELPAILNVAAEAGARTAGFVPLRLPYGLPDLFEAWLERHFPDRKERVLHRIREIRGGALNDSRFGTRMRGEGEYADQIRALFRVTCRRLGLNRERLRLSSARFTRPAPPRTERGDTGQLEIFGG